MKYNILILFFILSVSVFSQQDSLTEALKYYPLHVGDYWEYYITKGPYGIIDTTWIAYKTVVGDTLLSNKKKYFIVKSNRMNNSHRDFISTNLIRIDSTTGNVYQHAYPHDEIIDSLLVEENDTLYSYCMFLSETYIKEVFGNNVDVRYYKLFCVVSDGYDHNYELAKGFGKIHEYYWLAPFYRANHEYVLVYTKINGSEYGIKTDVAKNDYYRGQYVIKQNYPNPFNPTTTITYYIPNQSFIKLSVYNQLGEEISTLVKGTKSRGEYQIQFDGSRFSSGVYYYTLDYGESKTSKKMLLIK